MDKLPKFVDMEMSEKERKEEMSCVPTPRKYPYGLSLSLGQDELDKLSLSGDCEIGDMLHMHAICKVTCVSSYDTEDASNQRVELQITHIMIESEDEENEEATPMMGRIKSPYK